jgi:hypothetical protein
VLTTTNIEDRWTDVGGRCDCDRQLLSTGGWAC